MRPLYGLVVLLAGVLLLALASPPAVGGQASTRTDLDVVKQIDQDLRNLEANLARLDQQMSDAHQVPTPTDPILRELAEVHRTGWQLHRKQWSFQRDHLQFARDLLRRARSNPDERQALMGKWRQHEQEFETGMAHFRDERAALEQQHLRIEGQLIERDLDHALR